MSLRCDVAPSGSTSHWSASQPHSSRSPQFADVVSSSVEKPPPKPPALLFTEHVNSRPFPSILSSVTCSRATDPPVRALFRRASSPKLVLFMTISLSKSGACSVTKASAFARSAVGGLRFGDGPKAVAAVSSSAIMAEGRIDGVELTAVAVQTAGTVSFVCGPQRWRKFGRRCQQALWCLWATLPERGRLPTCTYALFLPLGSAYHNS